MASPPAPPPPTPPTKALPWTNLEAQGGPQTPGLLSPFTTNPGSVTVVSPTEQTTKVCRKSKILIQMLTQKICQLKSFIFPTISITDDNISARQFVTFFKKYNILAQTESPLLLFDSVKNCRETSHMHKKTSKLASKVFSCSTVIV